ncbi:GNAT family N-acetyltransferase [Georgenia sp. Z1491]|uniref:GNAT family N-acetyltransferase n=1 Tax=Georgenia sp. Z1491 TaxID=3416707 RepID=UPI003CECB73B
MTTTDEGTTRPATTAPTVRPDGLPAGVHLLHLVAPAAEEIAAGATPSAAFRALTDIDAEYLLERLGDTDLLGDPATRLGAYADQSSVRRVVIVAATGPVAERLAAGGTAAPAAVASGADDPGPEAHDVLGYLAMDLELRDNTRTCGVELFTRVAHRGQGIGDALWRAATDVARAEGRSVVQAWVDHEPPAGDAEPIRPTRSEGAIARDAAARFCTDRGLVLEQVERHSVLHVAGRERAWRGALDQARGWTAPTDEIVTWVGATPEAELAHIAELMRRMSTDVPLGGLDWEEEAWDAERVRTTEAARLASGHRTYLVSAVRDTTTRALVAFSKLTVPLGRPAAWQDETLVMKEHRGRRLGTVVKLVNQLALLERFPDVERIHTWNAAENRHMLDVNHAVGFELASLSGAWQGPLR